MPNKAQDEFSNNNLGFQIPTKSILELADFVPSPTVTMDTKKEYILLSYRSAYKTLEDLNQKEINLGGLRINPITNISTGINYFVDLKLQKVHQKNMIEIDGLPHQPKISHVSWSPDETKIAFTNTSTTGVELWVIDIANAKAKKLTSANLNANVGNPINWFRDSKNLLVRMLIANRPSIINVKKEVPAGPIIMESDGSKAQNRTYPDLLKNATDEINFVTLTTSELHKISLEGVDTLFKVADMYVSELFSPDGKYLFVTTLRKPFSYLVQLNRFAQLSVLYDCEGNFVKTANEIQLSEVLPQGFMAVREGKRLMNWRTDQPSTLYFAMALDGGDPKVEVPHRDAIYQWESPFEKEPTLLTKTISRFYHVIWGNENVAIMQDEWYDTRNEKTYLFNPSAPELDPIVLSDRNFQDVYSDPGIFEATKNKFGKYVLAIENNCLYRIGEGFTPNGQFPFIDELNLTTLVTTRIYQSNFTDKMEEIFSIEDFKNGEVMVRIQSKNEYPNYYFRNIYKEDELTQITFFSNQFESIKNVHKELIKYKREDGVELSGTLYLPENYDFDKKEKLPLLIWAYPTEYKDKNSAGQSTANPNEFTFPYYGSFVYWVTRGYAVLDDAAFPIIGEGDEHPNDTFIEQLTANAKAAIDAIDALGYIDINKVGIGGHSYGAFMTANLLTHTSLFACGIARSGAYNRTLTPFGFQSEQRNYWDASEVYNSISPFMTAEKMKTPLLLVHGESDNNPGTFTLQTERYFQALKGLGAPVRMVILPKESHGYVAKENIFHLLWEQDQFLEKYLKN